MQFYDAVVGGRSVGTPGTVKLLAQRPTNNTENCLGTVLFGPAIKLARSGFKISARLNALIAASAQSLYRFESTRNYFLSEEGVPLFTGTLVKNIAYANTLTAIAEGGADAFYRGEIAEPDYCNRQIRTG